MTGKKWDFDFRFLFAVIGVGFIVLGLQHASLRDEFYNDKYMPERLALQESRTLECLVDIAGVNLGPNVWYGANETAYTYVSMNWECGQTEEWGTIRVACLGFGNESECVRVGESYNEPYCAPTRKEVVKEFTKSELNQCTVELPSWRDVR